MTGNNSKLTKNKQLGFEQFEAEFKAKENEQEIKELLRNNADTSEIWDRLIPTQENYGGTILPKSFTVKTEYGEVWTHANATKHIYEAIRSTKTNTPLIKSSCPPLYVQFILYDYYIQLSGIVERGIVFNKVINTSHWEFIFSPPRQQNKKPVIKHAKFKGLN